MIEPMELSIWNAAFRAELACRSLRSAVAQHAWADAPSRLEQATRELARASELLDSFLRRHQAWQAWATSVLDQDQQGAQP